MASVLEYVLKGDLSPDLIVKWLQDAECENENFPEILVGLENLRQEFIPFFLNYLRDHTIHLLQSSKSATPSPAKTPSLKKIQKSVRKKKNEGGKRQQLFGSSPAGDVDDFKNLPSSVFSPNTSLDSPGCINPRLDRSNSRGNLRSGYANQKSSPQCGSQRSPYNQHTPDQQRSKQKFSLGEFLVTPDSENSGWRRKSPHTGNRRDSNDNSPSPVISHGRKSGGGRRKHASSPLVQTFPVQEQSTPPIFNLTSKNDFPPMENNRQSNSNEKKTQQNFKSFDSKMISQQSCDNRKTSRVINFSNPDQSAVNQFSRDMLHEVKRISPITVSANSNSSGQRLKSKSVQLKGDNSGPSTHGARRITPTLVKVDQSTPQNSVFLVPIEETVTDQKFAVPETSEWTPAVGKTDCDTKEKTDRLAEERECLKLERMKRQTSGEDSSVSVSSVTPRKPSLEQSASVIEIVEALLAEVTHQDKLDTLVELYAKCLHNNLLPNLVVELYFLVQLLTARGGEEETTFIYGGDLIEENYFSTVHNTVYFAVSVLEIQRRLLTILDRGTLRLLIENPRVATFSADLFKYLEDLHAKAELQKGPAFPKSPIGSVSFQADTDNRKNFPNDKSFHTFKRQRDGFYELIREWEASRMNPSYNMGEMFAPRVRALVNMMTELANLIHFSRLFQSQLIAMCKDDGSICTKDEDEEIALLSQLKRTNPAKFKRLQERFIKPLSSGGPCPLPTFSGMQEFFRDFIVAASSPLLNQHLSDTFAAKVSELSETTFANSDEDDAVATNGDLEEQDMFASVLLSARLVGKFLGFVTFLPYRSEDRIPDTIQSSYILIRNKHQPPLDLLEHLCAALVSGSLTLTVPWVVEFLAMMDGVAPNLNHFQMVLHVLLYIHRYVWQQLQDEMSYSGALLVAVISWLLENPVIPDGFFFSELPDNVLDMVQGRLPTLAALDNRNFVDQSLLYTCCPYLGELKSLLVEFAVGSNSKISAIRKITPVSADLPKSKSLTARQLQLQMEENFFHNHPASMKRVVDFVADRTASNYIKKFRATLLPQSLDNGKERAAKQVVTVAEGSPTSKLKDKVSSVTNRVAQELHAEVKVCVTKDAPSYCDDRAVPLMTLLLPDDQAASVITMAASISVRIAMEKITQWMNKHITTAMYQSEIIPDLDKINKLVAQSEQVQEVTERGDNKTVIQSTTCVHETGPHTAKCHDTTLQHPSEVLIRLKDWVKYVSLRKLHVSEAEVVAMLKQIRKTVERRKDVLPSVYKAFTQLTVDFLIALLMENLPSYTSKTISEFIDLWLNLLRDKSVVYIYCGRVVHMVENTADPKVTWDQYTHLLLQLVDKKLINLTHIQETSLKFLPYLQNQGTITSLCQCLCALAETESEDERREQLGTCLEMLYHMLPDHTCPHANKILHVLGEPLFMKLQQQEITTLDAIVTETTATKRDITRLDTIVTETTATKREITPLDAIVTETTATKREITPL